MVEQQKLSNIQLELLKIFSRPIPEAQLLEIKKLLSDYFAENVDKGMDALTSEKNWDNTVVEDWLSEHLRTPY